MKKTYVKPFASFESFELSSSIAGESTTLYASHYSTAYSKIMFVTYVQ